MNILVKFDKVFDLYSNPNKFKLHEKERKLQFYKLNQEILKIQAEKLEMRFGLLKIIIRKLSKDCAQKLRKVGMDRLARSRFRTFRNPGSLMRR